VVELTLEEPPGEATHWTGRKRARVPDLTLGIRDAHAAEPSLFFVEMHRCTEPNERVAQPELQRLKGKFADYLAYARAKRHLEKFGVSNFRVLTVTGGGESKMENSANAAHNVCQGNGAGRFLVTTIAAFEVADPFEAVWLDASGKEVRFGV